MSLAVFWFVLVDFRGHFDIKIRGQPGLVDNILGHTLHMSEIEFSKRDDFVKMEQRLIPKR